MKEKVFWGDLGVHGRIILKRVIKENKTAQELI
jgi:hypothetical protein